MAGAAALLVMGCQSQMQRIDRNVSELMQQTSREMNAGPGSVPPVSPDKQSTDAEARMDDPNRDYASESLVTINPDASELSYTPLTGIEEVMERFERYDVEPDDAITLDLESALGHAITHSREHRFAEENYILEAIRLLIERHRWGPRFFNEISADVIADADDGLYDSTLEVLNEFRVTQRLPYGGEVAARAVARASEDLHQRVAGEKTQSADIILEADIPLLRGAGISAREPRIQAERNVIYAARDFERFRREFLFDIAVDYLDLVVQQQSIINSERQLESLEQLQERERALYESGRKTRFEAALAENATYEARDRLIGQRERFRLALDRFKIRLGMPIEQFVAITPVELGLPMPATTVDDAVRQGLTYRLDLQTNRDQVDDARRGVAIARNDLLPDLNLTGSATFRTDEERDRAGLRFDAEETDLRAGVQLDLPLDREIERLSVRQATVDLERTVRAYQEFRDSVIINVRSSVRTIERARFSLEIQERNIDIAEQRVASIEADPDRATARDFTEAVNQLSAARDARDAARRDLDVAILRYLLDTGQLRVDADGQLDPPSGMVLPNGDDADDAQPNRP